MNETDVISALRFHGGRVTKARRAIIQSLLNAKNHITAEELVLMVKQKYPAVHLSTVYRNLEELEKLGIIRHTHFLHSPAIYHLEGQIHIHLVCEICGKIVESPVELFSPVSRELKKTFGFSINFRHFALAGRCSACYEDN